MSGGLGAVLGVEPGMFDPTWNTAALRVGLSLGALVWAWLVARTRPAVSLAAGLVWCVAAIGFWVLCLARPYGLFEDVETTRRAAEIAVVAASGDATEGSLSSAPASYPSWTGWLDRGVSPEALILMPSVLPLLAVPAIAVVLLLSVRPGQQASVASVLWLLCATSEPGAARGLSFLPEFWRHPGSAIEVVAAGIVVSLLGRLPVPGTLRLVATAAVPLAVAVQAPSSAEMAPSEALLALTLDQGLLLVVAAWGLVRNPDPTARGLTLGAGLGVLAGLLGPGTDVWACHTLYRLGLVLAAVGPLTVILAQVGDWLLSRWQAARHAGLDARRLGTAGLVLVLAPSSFIAWWNPSRLDPAFEASREPFPRALTEAMGWVRQATPADAVFLASDAYAPAVAVLGGRRLLRSSMLSDADDPRRTDAESRLLRQRNLREWVFRYGVRFVFVAPGDFGAYGVQQPEDLGSRPGFRLAYSNWEGYRVYELVR